MAEKKTVQQQLDAILAAVESMRQDSAANRPEIKVSMPKLASAAAIGAIFTRNSRSSEDTYQRVRFTGYLLNSTTVAESLSAGKVLVLHREQGTIFFIKGNEYITLL